MKVVRTQINLIFAELKVGNYESMESYFPQPQKGAKDSEMVKKKCKKKQEINFRRGLHEEIKSEDVRLDVKGK